MDFWIFGFLHFGFCIGALLNFEFRILKSAHKIVYSSAKSIGTFAEEHATVSIILGEESLNVRNVQCSQCSNVQNVSIFHFSIFRVCDFARFDLQSNTDKRRFGTFWRSLLPCFIMANSVLF